MRISSKETYQDGRPMAWSGEFREEPGLATEEDIQEVRELYEGRDVKVLVLERGDTLPDDVDYGGDGDSIFLCEIEQLQVGGAVYLVDGKLLLNDCLFDVEVS